ncbi:hypothetical protein BHT10_25680 [Burkholderia pseudomallei]|nr:hypothetical protein BHT10_25680 [Burkholderia pseudomallei]
MGNAPTVGPPRGSTKVKLYGSEGELLQGLIAIGFERRPSMTSNPPAAYGPEHDSAGLRCYPLTKKAVRSRAALLCGARA